MSNLDTQVTLPSDPSQVSQVEPLLERFTHRLNISSDVYGNMLISLTEAVSNAILHGNQGDNTKQVCISMQRHNDALEVSVSDQGPGFDPHVVPDPTSADCIEKCGGRGLFLMKHLSDDCRFVGNGSTVRMRFKI
jgi:serine/threonine-protein kinase RsbW